MWSGRGPVFPHKITLSDTSSHSLARSLSLTADSFTPPSAHTLTPTARSDKVGQILLLPKEVLRLLYPRHSTIDTRHRLQRFDLMPQ